MIRVVNHPKGYAFPSIFGLVYVATAGYIGALALVRLRGPLRVIISLVAYVLPPYLFSSESALWHA